MVDTKYTATRHLEEGYSLVRKMLDELEAAKKQQRELEYRVKNLMELNEASNTDVVRLQKENQRLFTELNEERNLYKPIPTFDEARAYSADPKEEKSAPVPHVNVVRHTFECSEGDRITLTVQKA